MIKKCMTYCNTDKYIRLRNNIFYFTMELPRQNGKRRFFCKSLHTYNYYEAREKAKIMAENVEHFDTIQFMNDFNTLWNQVIFDYSGTGGNFTGFAARRISDKTNPMVLKQLKNMSEKLDLIQQNQLDPGDKIMLGQLKSVIPQINALLAKVDNVEQLLSSVQIQQPKQTKKYKIGEVLKSMLKKSNNQKAETDRKNNSIIKMLSEVGLNTDCDYDDFNNPEIIQNIAENIKGYQIKGDAKRKYVRYIRDLIKQAHILAPDSYQENFINLLPNLPKTPKHQQKPHLPYSESQLLEMFDPKYDHFKTNPDEFWTALIGLFTGARINAATTLQYGDIINQDGLDCIYFRQNHPVKHLKTEASERIVPIPSQLLNMGFVDWVKARKEKLNTTDDDFVFPKCKTKTGNFENKYWSRGLAVFLKEIGVKSKNGDQLDFHSFRKNASLRLQNAGIIQSFINDIIGWEGKNTMEQSYSNHTIPQIKEQIDKLNYDFLQPHFDKWKEIMKIKI